jgi:hypothetical protein
LQLAESRYANDNWEQEDHAPHLCLLVFEEMRDHGKDDFQDHLIALLLPIGHTKLCTRKRNWAEEGEERKVESDLGEDGDLIAEMEPNQRLWIRG